MHARGGRAGFIAGAWPKAGKAEETLAEAPFDNLPARPAMKRRAHFVPLKPFIWFNSEINILSRLRKLKRPTYAKEAGQVPMKDGTLSGRSTRRLFFFASAIGTEFAAWQPIPP